MFYTCLRSIFLNCEMFISASRAQCQSAYSSKGLLCFSIRINSITNGIHNFLGFCKDSSFMTIQEQMKRSSNNNEAFLFHRCFKKESRGSTKIEMTISEMPHFKCLVMFKQQNANSLSSLRRYERQKSRKCSD